MDGFLFEYMNHPESKFEGDRGILSRKDIRVREIVYIGKESDKLNEVSITGVGDEIYSIYKSEPGKLEYYEKIILGTFYTEVEKTGFDKKDMEEISTNVKCRNISKISK